jgi:hypothetical protein
MSPWSCLSGLSGVLLVTACASGSGEPVGDDDDTPDAAARPDSAELPPDAETPPIDAAPIDAAPIDAMPIDAMPIDAMPIDAMPADAGPIDAMPIDAGCTVQTVQLLTNASFDAALPGAPWVDAPFDPAYPLISAPPDGFAAHTAPYVVWMAGFHSATDSIYQTVTIPASATALQLTGQRRVASEEGTTTAYDNVRIQIRNGAGAVLEQLVAWSNRDQGTAWSSFTLSATSAYAGQSIRLHLESDTDSTLFTSFYFDTFALNATVCE